jgi:hypothetical protein
MNQFGKVRDVNNRADDYGYFMASGEATALPSTQAELIALMDALSANIATIQSQIPALQKARNDWYVDYQKKVAEQCHNYSNRNKREGCIADREFKKGKVEYYDNLIKSKNDQIALVKDRISEIKKTLENFRGVSTALAQSGKTEEQIRITAQAQADVLTKQAETESQISQRQSKS